MTVEETREHKRVLKVESRRNQTPMKTFWVRRKNKEYQRKKRATRSGGKLAQPTASPSVQSTTPQPPIATHKPSPMKQAEYNFVSSLRKRLAKKTPGKFAKMMSNIARNTRRNCPQTQEALRNEGLQTTDRQRHTKHRQLLGQISSARKRLFTFKNKKRRKDALPEKDRQEIGLFYVREDISRALPHKRFSTKHGPGFVMQQTISSAHKIFQAEHQDVKVGYTLFSRLRPKNVRKISNQFLDTCQCVYCVNVRMKVLALNRTISANRMSSHMRVPDERGLFKLLLCDKGEAAFNKATCVDGSCSQCGDIDKTINTHYAELKAANPTVTWTRWCRQSTGTTKEPTVTTALVSELLEELTEDIKHPAKGTTFVQHLFAADWQHHQYRLLKKSLTSGQLILVMDFAENRKTKMQDEIKSAHWSKQQFTLHPVVAFYKAADGELVRHAIHFVSNDLGHDYHAVHHYTQQSLHIFQSLGVTTATSEVFIFSDNCSAQYKCYGTFADLTTYQESVHRLYYGAEHGKGEADGETGVVSKAVDTAVLCRQINIKNAEDFFNWCDANMRKDAPKSKRQFVYVKSEDIKRQRPESVVKPIRGSRKIHQMVGVASDVVKSKKFACFCEPCFAKNFHQCENKQHVGLFTCHRLELQHTTLERGSEDDQPSPVLQPLSPQPPLSSPPPPMSRSDFFKQLQQDLMKAKRSGFGAFTACAQDCMHRTRAYPLPFPVLQPEFERSQVDETADNQRPPNAAPPGHFSLATAADGNCMVRALSFAAFGDDDHHIEIRVRIVCELALRKTMYLSPDYVSRGASVEDGVHLLAYYHASGDFEAVPSLDTAFDCEVMSSVQNSRDLGMWHLLAAANVLQCIVNSVFPLPVPEMNRQCLPDVREHAEVFIQWCSVRAEDRVIHDRWSANHCVPVVQDRHYKAPQSFRIGDYVKANFVGVDGSQQTYHGVVTPHPVWMPKEVDEVSVKCMRAKEKGRYFVFPTVDDIIFVCTHSSAQKNPMSANYQQPRPLLFLTCR